MDTHINPRPVVSCYRPIKTVNINQLVPDLYDRITVDQVFDLIRDIRDPEHPYSLEELNVVRENLIIVNDNLKDCIIRIEFTPTVPHCSLATLIGLCIRVQLNRNLPKYAKIDIVVTPGKHSYENEINKQINDKERVQAAMENSQILEAVGRCLAPFDV